MNKLEIAKLATSTIVGAGSSKITQQIIANNVHPTTVLDKITVGAGAIVAGMIAADKSKEYTNAKIDTLVAAWNSKPSTTTV